VIFRTFCAGLAAAGLLALGATTSVAAQTEADTAPETAAQLTLDDLRTFTDVFNQVRRNYVEEVGDHTLLDAAIRGMLMDLDPHSAYLPPENFRDLQDNSRGRYRGIGVDVEIRDGQLVVRAIINDSPADQAGINPGDIFTAIAGRPVKGRDLQEAIDDLLGEPGTEVELVVQAPDGTVRTVMVEREYLQIPTLSFQLLDEAYGYFKMTQFHRDSARDLRESLDSIAGDGIVLAGLVIDLRGNPGGVLHGAIELADGFLDDGVIVTTRGRNATMQMQFDAQPGQWLEGLPLVVLVDRASASASEVFAGAMQDHARGVIVGERTFGKGSVQTVLPLRNGGGIKLTTARYYTPSGRSIQAEGIEPDIVYEAGGQERAGEGRKREADLERHLDRLPAEVAPASADAPASLDDERVRDMLEALERAGVLLAPGSSEPGDEAG